MALAQTMHTKTHATSTNTLARPNETVAGTEATSNHRDRLSAAIGPAGSVRKNRSQIHITIGANLPALPTWRFARTRHHLWITAGLGANVSYDAGSLSVKLITVRYVRYVRGHADERASHARVRRSPA
jgi:hypothetical protein